jgi:D-glycero-alpha-D-manno-heptose-7-phosphate kinase
VRARAPLRISFSGGGTDVAPYPSKYGGAVLSTSIDHYAYCTVEDAVDEEFALSSADLEINEIYQDLSGVTYNGKLDLAKAVVRTMWFDHAKKFRLSLLSDAPPGSGLGSSSSLMVAIIKAVGEFQGYPLDRYALAEMAYKLERVELGIRGGYQDQYAATFGGFNFIEFMPDKTLVNPLRVSSEILEELHAGLILVDLGRSRLSSDILSRQIASYEREDTVVMESLHRIKALAYEMKALLLRGHLTEFGKLLREEWVLKKRLDKMITNERIDKLYEGALENGALGGKILGAGDGGHMVFLVDFHKKRNLLKYLISHDCRQIPFNFDTQGVVSWRIQKGEVLA